METEVIGVKMMLMTLRMVVNPTSKWSTFSRSKSKSLKISQSWTNSSFNHKTKQKTTFIKVYQQAKIHCKRQLPKLKQTNTFRMWQSNTLFLWMKTRFSRATIFSSTKMPWSNKEFITTTFPWIQFTPISSAKRTTSRGSLSSVRVEAAKMSSLASMRSTTTETLILNKPGEKSSSTCQLLCIKIIESTLLEMLTYQ